MTKTPNRSSLSRRVLQAASSFKAMLFRSLFRSSIYESIRPVLSGRMGWLQTLSSLIGRGSENIHKGGVLRVSAKERAKRSAAREFRRRFVMAEQLELRALMAADLGLDPTLSQQPVAAEVGTMVPGQVSQPVGYSNEVVFVDPGVTDPQSLMQGLRAGVEFVMLDGSKDGVAQIAEYLQGKSGIQAIHLVGHGRAGEIYLGSSVLGNGTLDGYAAELSSIGSALTADGDILVYGCETAQGTQGQQFLQQLARLTSADVAGSSDITGAANLGGDWDLEERIGDVGSKMFAEANSLARYEGIFPPTIGGTASWTTTPGTLVRLTGITIVRDGASNTSTGTVTIAPVGTPTGILSTGANPGGDDIQVGVNNSSAGNTLTVSTKSGGSRTPWTYIYQAGGTSYFNPGSSTAYTVPGFTPANAGVYTLRITATDSTGTSTRDVTVSAGRSPTMTAGGTLSYTENADASVIDAGLTVNDLDGGNLSSARVTISAGRTTGDLLGFTTQNGITGSYDSANGILSLAGSATIAQYQSALRSVTFSSTSENPTATSASRTISWTVTDPASLTSTAVTSTVNITALNDAPTFTGTISGTYTEAGAALAFLSSAAVADVDASNFNGGSVTVSLSAYQTGDVLSINNQGTGAGQIGVSSGTVSFGGNTIGTFSGGSGTNLVITFNSANATPAAVQALMGALRFSSTSNNPTNFGNATTRTATVTLNDGGNTGTGGAQTASVSGTINVSGVNNAPTVTAPGSFSVTEDVAGNLVYTGTPFADVDTANLTVTLSVTDGTITGATVAGITITNNSSSSVSFAGTVSALNTYFTTAGRITYTTALNNTTQQTLTTSVSDGVLSNSATSNINITTVNDAPTLTAGGTLAYTENEAAKVIDSTITVNDVDNATLKGATVTISAGLTTGDILGFIGQNGITGQYNSTTGVLTLTGTASLANYQTALRSVTYRSTSPDPTGTSATRTISWRVDDGSASSNLSNIATSTINITPILSAPRVDLNGGLDGTDTLDDFTQGTPVLLAPGALITDADGGDGMKSLVITLTNAFSGDELTMGSVSGLQSSYTGGVLTITPVAPATTATLALFQQALRTVAFNNSTNSPNLTERVIQVQATDAGNLLGNIAVARVSMTDTNDAPVYQNNLVNQTPSVGLPFSYSLPGSSGVPGSVFVDPENQAMTYQAYVVPSTSATVAQQSPLPGWLTFNSSLMRFYGVAPTDQPLTIRLVATDTEGLSTNGHFTITPKVTVSESGTEKFFAYVSFPRVFDLVEGANYDNAGFYQEETNSFKTASAPLAGSNFIFYQSTFPVGADPAFFNGNNVAGTLTYLNTSGQVVNIVGVASRPIKTSGNNTRGFYMWVPDRNQAFGKEGAILLVIDANYFANSTVYNSSSDRVDTDMNNYLTGNIFSIASASRAENNGPISFVVTRTKTGPMSVQFNTSIGSLDTASANDFTSTSQLVSFTQNETALTKTVTVALVNDSVFEADETFTVSLSNPSTGSRIDVAQATGTILNDDAAPSVSIANAANIEGNKITFTVTRTGNAQAVQTVRYATALATTAPIASPDDFTSTSGVLTFNPGETSKTFTVQTTQDELLEPNETFLVNLTNATGGLTIGTAQATGTIRDDESTVFYYVDPPTPTVEGNAIQFVIRRTGTVQNIDFSNANLPDVGQSITYWTSIRSSDNSEVGDFTGIPIGTPASITFGANDRSVTVTVNTTNDSIYEGDETFGFFLGNPSTLLAGNSTATETNPDGNEVTATIVDNDAAPKFSVVVGSPSSVVEGNPITFIITRDADSEQPQSIDYSTVIRASDSTAINDFTATSGTFTFNPGEFGSGNSKTVTVTTIEDSIAEGPETFGFAISNPTGGAQLDPTKTVATGTLLDANTAPTASNTTVGTVTKPALEDIPYVFGEFDFGYTDAQNAPLWSIQVKTLPAIGGTLTGVLQKATTSTPDGNGGTTLGGWTPVAVDEVLTISGPLGVGAGALRYVPPTNANNQTLSAAPTFSVRVSDGVNFSSDSPTTNRGTVTINILPVNDEPSGADKDVDVFVGGDYLFTESDFGYTDPIDNDSFLNVIFTDVPQQADARGTVQVRLSGPTNGGIGSLANAQEIVASAFNLALTGQSFTTADPINPPVDGFDKVQQGRYGKLFLNSTNGAFKFERYTDNGVAVYIESYNVDGSTKTPVFKPLNLASGVSAFDGFVFRITDSTAADPISQFRRTLSIRLTSDGHGSFAVSHAIWRSINDNESVAIQKVMAGEVRYSPCFCGIPRYKLDGTTQVTVPTAGQPGFGAPYFSVKFKVQDDGGTLNGGIDTDQSPNKIDFSLINNFTPAINIPLEQKIDEDTVLRFGSVGQSDALYLVYAPPVPVGQSVDQVRATVRVSDESRPGSLSLEGSNYTAVVTPIVESSRTVGYVIEGLVANVNAVLADLVFTPNANLFSTYDQFPLQEDWGTRYPPVNGIGGTHTFAALTVVAENIPSSGSIQYPPSKRSMDILVVNVNDAPVVIGESPSLSVDEDVTNSAGGLISTLVGANFSDPTDAAPVGSLFTTNQALAGIAITSYTPASVGNWQYSANGTVWTTLESLSSTSTARSLPASYRLRFVPVSNFNGTIPSLTTYLIEDSSTPVTAGVLNVSNRGGTTRFSADPLTILGSVTAVNDAPIATGASSLAAILEDNLNPPGNSVSNLFAPRFNDSADQVTGGTSANTLAGIAIINYTRASSKGDWQYSSNNGTSWTTISSSIAPTEGLDTAALTLASTDVLRFLPRTDFNGPAPTLTVRLLETPRSVTSGATVDVSINGGSTTISSGTVVLSHSVTARNDAPVASGSATLSAINEDTTNPPGAAVSSLFTGNYSDAKDQVIGGTSANSFVGIALVSYTEDLSKGVWQYSANGTSNWTTIEAVAGQSAATILPVGHSLRFLPAANFNGPAPTLSALLIDSSISTSLSFATGVNISSIGTTTQYSSSTVVLSHNVTAVNDPPISTNDTIIILEDEVRPLTTADFGNYSDVENQPFSTIKIVTRPDKGTLQYNVDGVWTSINSNGGDYSISDASIKFRYIPAQNENGNNYTTIVYRVSDGVDFSVSTYTLTIDVTPVNDPPISTNDSVTSNEDAVYYFNVSDFGTYSDIENNQATVPNMIKITSLPSLGILEYNNGTSWVSALNAEITPNLLTGSSATSKLRYTPPANAFGSPFTGFGFKVSDGTDYSLSSYTVTINIAPVNDAPVASGSASLASVFKNDTSPPWATVSSLFSGNFSDPLDTGNTTDSFYGVAIRGLTQDASKGSWEYKIGSTVGVVPNSSDATAFVLRAADSLRFVPFADENTSYVGNATPLSVRLIETKSAQEASDSGASDASGSTTDVSNNGGTTVYSAATVDLNHEVKGTLLVKAFNDVSEGSDAIFRVSLDSNSNVGGTSVTLGLTNDLTPGSALPTSDYGPSYREAYYYDNSSNKQTLPISNNVLTLPQNVTVFYVSVPTTNDTPKVFEGPETFSLSASITVEGTPISNSDAATIRDDGNGKVFNEDGTVNNSATPDNDLSVFVTGYGPVNEGSTYAMFKVDAASGDGLNFSVINGTATLVTPTIEFSLDGTTWTVFNASATGGFPTVPAGTGNIGTVYVRVTITSESDSMYEGSESFSLRATSRANSSVTATAATSIIDNGTGLKYTGNFTGTPIDPETDGTNLDNDLSIDVTSYSPVNERSTWAMFKVVGGASDRIDLAVSDGVITGTTGLSSAVVEFSYNGSTWFTYDSSDSLYKPVVPGSVGTGTFYVRVNITAEQETALDTGEVFTLTATSNGPGAKSNSANTTIVDNGSGTIFTGNFGNDLPQVSNNFRDDDRVIAVRDKVFSRTASGVVLTDVRANDTTRNGATISSAIGLNPQSSTVSSTFSNSEGTWTVLSGGEVRFAPVASQKTDPTPIEYAISADNGSNYSLNKAQLFVDYGVGVVPDSANSIPPTQEFVSVDVLLNDTLADTYDSDTLKLVDVGNGNALVDTLTVAQGTWRVVAGTGAAAGRKVLEFQANMLNGQKNFAGNPSPVSYAVRDRVTDGGYRGGSLSSFTTATIGYLVTNSNPFFIRINDRNNDSTPGALPWDVIVVDNVLAGVTVNLYDENGVWSQTIVTTAADASNTVGQIFYQGSTTNFSTVKVDATSKPVTVGSVANINLSTTTQSRRAATIEIQAFDSLFIAQSTSNTNVLVSPMSGTKSSGSALTFRESLGRDNQLFPTSSTLGSSVGNVIENYQTVASSVRTVSVSRSSGQFNMTAGQPTSLMKSLVTTNSAASQIVSLNIGGKVLESDPDGSGLAEVNRWFFSVGMSKSLAEARTLEQSGAWTTAILMPSIKGANDQGSQKTFENFRNFATTLGVFNGFLEFSADEAIMVSNAFDVLESDEASGSKKLSASELRSRIIRKRQES